MAHCLIVGPIVSSARTGLSAVLPAALAAVRGEANQLSLPARTGVVVLLVDGLGDDALLARAGHARTLAGSARRRIATGCPTTTAAALTTLTTGAPPGRHGVVSFSALDPATDRVVNQLRGFDDQLPAGWQRETTVFERAVADGIGAFAVGPRHYATSGFTREVLRGATYVGARTVEERLDAAFAAVRNGGRAIAYCYVPELDAAAHREGWTSATWIALLEAVDEAVLAGTRRLRRGETLLVTADHGILDVPPDAHVLLDTVPGLLDGVHRVAGEPRLLHLHLDDAEQPEALAARWRDALGARADVLTRPEALEAGWFGAVDPEVAPRIGQVLVAARRRNAFYDDSDATGRGMVGQHGAWTDAERFVPLARFDG